MFEGERVYYSNNRSDPHGFEAEDGGPDSLPSLKQARLFFEQYLHHGSGALRRQLLAEAEKSTKCLLELDLFDLIEYQHRVQPADLECVNTPLCGRDRHRAPPDFAHRLARCLRERPLVYLPVCEKACEEIAAKGAIVQGASDGPPSKRERTFDVQINLIDSSKKPTPIRSLLSHQQEHFVVTTGIIISCKAPMSRMQVRNAPLASECVGARSPDTSVDIHAQQTKDVLSFADAYSFYSAEDLTGTDCLGFGFLLVRKPLPTPAPACVYLAENNNSVPLLQPQVGHSCSGMARAASNPSFLPLFRAVRS